jgi:hypothetical protein
MYLHPQPVTGFFRLLLQTVPHIDKMEGIEDMESERDIWIKGGAGGVWVVWSGRRW